MKSAVPTRDLEIVRDIVLTSTQKYGVKVYLFGSQARGDAHPLSDIDVAILPSGPLPASLMFNLRDALEESDVIRTVDVVNLDETDAAFRARVLEEGIPWTE